MTLHVVPVTVAQGAVTDEALLRSAERVHLQLRPQLAGRYLERLEQVLSAGAEMAVAVAGGRVAGLTVFRVIEKTHSGRELYCDDLVTDEGQRSAGVGRALMQYMEGVCRERGCDTFALDSGCHRPQAHKFYFREGMTILAFHFSKKPAA